MTVRKLLVLLMVVSAYTYSAMALPPCNSKKKGDLKLCTGDVVDTCSDNRTLGACLGEGFEGLVGGTRYYEVAKCEAIDPQDDTKWCGAKVSEEGEPLKVTCSASYFCRWHATHGCRSIVQQVDEETNEPIISVIDDVKDGSCEFQGT